MQDTGNIVVGNVLPWHNQDLEIGIGRAVDKKQKVVIFAYR